MFTDNKLNLVVVTLITFPSNIELKGRVNIKSTIYARKQEIYVKYLADIKRIMLLYNTAFMISFISPNSTQCDSFSPTTTHSKLYYILQGRKYLQISCKNEPYLVRPNNWACILTCLYISIITYNEKNVGGEDIPLHLGH